MTGSHDAPQDTKPAAQPLVSGQTGSRRALRIVLAYSCGAIALGISLLLEMTLVTSLSDGGKPVSLTSLAWAVQSGFAVAPLLAIAGLPPAVFSISIAEWYDRRAPLAHALAGVAVALFCLYSLGFGTMTINDDSGLLPEFSVLDLVRASPLYILPGLLAGLVYWRVRGEVPKAT